MLLSTTSESTGSQELFQQLQEYESNHYMASIALLLYNYIIVQYHNTDTESGGSNSNNCTIAGNDGTDAEDEVELHASTVFSLFIGHVNSTMDDTKNNDLAFDDVGRILQESDRRSIISYIANVIRKTLGTMTMDSVFTKLDLFDDEKVFHQKSIQNRVKYKINELIVLLDHCITLDDVHRCIDSLLLLTINDNNKSGSDHPIHHTSDNNTSAALHVSCPRRDHVRALIHEIDRKDNDDTTNEESNGKTLLFINVPGIMYRLIQNRAVVTQKEWYDAFLDHVQNKNNYVMTETMTTTDDWFSIFGCGIRHLQVSGLIRRNEGRNHSIQYERTSLVWCGGD